MLYLLLLILIHFIILNPLEKLYFSYNIKDTNRPLEKCKNVKYNDCNGFPSGHAEIITIVCGFLLYYEIINVPVALILIVLTCIQRLVTHMHTFKQVTYGVWFGIIYSYLYWITQYSKHSLIISFISIIIITLLIFFNIEHLLNEPIPSWVDPVMYPKMAEKKNDSFYIKICSIYIPLLSHYKCLFKSWDEVEDMMDQVIDKSKKYDCVVGVKSGGAIISDYISKKLNIKNYKIKVTNKPVEDNKMLEIPIFEFINKYVMKNVDYYVKEEIEDDLTNKQILLIDECISSGATMKCAIKYLESKGAKVDPIVLNSDRLNKETGKDIPILDDILICIWPWGYSN